MANGLTGGKINAIAQTPDGYLWLATDFGLLRFDGMRAAPWRPPAGQHLPSNNVSSLFAAGDGTLWIGTWKGPASWRDGRLREYPELAGFYVVRILEDHEATIWMSGADPLNGRVCRLRAGTVTCWGENARLGSGAFGLYEDSQRKVWVGAVSGLWLWHPGIPKLYPLTGEMFGVEAIGEDADGTLLVGWKGGIRRFDKGKIETYPLRGVAQFTATCILRDRDGGLWIGTRTEGLVHAHRGRADVFTPSDGLSGATVQNVFEDREGSIWVVTASGLDRFRDFAVTTFTAHQGLSRDLVSSVLADRDGSVWLATYGGLDRWRDGEIRPWRKREGKLNGLNPTSLFQDSRGKIWVSTNRDFGYLERDRFIPINGFPGGIVDSITEDGRGDLWVANQNEGLIHLSGDSVVEKVTWPRLNHKDKVNAVTADPVRGGLWLGFYDGSIEYFADGKVQASFTPAAGLGKGRVNHLRVDQDGTLWAATEGGLSRLKDSRFLTLGSKNGLPCDGVHWTVEDDDGSLWLYTQCGLVRIARPDLEDWIVAPENNNERRIPFAVFDGSDGMPIFAAALWRYTPAVAKAVNGKIWFKGFEGVSVIDPHHLPVNSVPPAVHIEQITANGKVVDKFAARDSHLQLPPRVRDLTIDYTALSFIAPEKIHFRYKLEGQDPDWREVINDRQVQYSNLAPRQYTFRVMACNNSGVWNEAGASLEFSVLPAFYQTTWFRILCGFGVLTLLWSIYQLRIQHMQRQFNIALDARVNERTRIARELHDTLLQTFHGAMFQFQAARNLMSRRPDEALQSLDDAIRETKKALGESREAIQDLRTEPMANGNLAELLTSTSRELVDPNANEHSPVFDLIEEGDRKTLSSTVSTDICRIALELMRNAYQHAHAQRIEAELRYGDFMFRLRIRDDGSGIDLKVLKEGGRIGHWGLRGIRERADRIGASLDLWSEPGRGTEAQLLVPAEIAYENLPQSYRARLVRKVKSRA